MSSRTAAIVVAFVLVVAAGVAGAVKAGRDAGAAEGRRAAIALRESQVAGCTRGRADREDAIRGWTAARVARLATARNRALPVKERLAAAAAAETYRLVIAGYRSRLVDCLDAFPPIG